MCGRRYLCAVLGALLVLAAPAAGSGYGESAVGAYADMHLRFVRGDGLYRGPSRGHTDEEHAKVIGMPRAYGYGASMGAWVLDYVAHWAGDRGSIRHSNVQYRFPPFEGDASLLDAEVTGKRRDPTLGAALVTLDFVMKNQDGAVLAKGPVEVQLPT